MVSPSGMVVVPTGGSTSTGVDRTACTPRRQFLSTSGTQPNRRLSNSTALSYPPSPVSKTDRYTECPPGVIGVAARSSGVAPSKVVPAAASEVNMAAPEEPTPTGFPAWSTAKLSGAETPSPSTVQVLRSSSATNASPYREPT